ncbi:hypothetical protein [Pseudomonas amygdali]|uniref:hypothetical protein n=1 Tax=Pseudomonas amygdali TaxID=47877 RepID=UPI0011C3D0F0|nr:hypothetical protein [Pseudomonas amygdali]
MPQFDLCRIYPDAPDPLKAGFAEHALSARALRYCRPVKMASKIGWLFYPPMDFAVLLKDDRILWSYGALAEWYILESAQLPGMADLVDSRVPEHQGASPPFLTALPEERCIQIWLGYSVRSPKNIALQIRGPINHLQKNTYEVIEGVIESEKWHGPLITVIKLRKENEPIIFRTHTPLIQCVPVDARLYEASACQSNAIDAFGSFSESDWAGFFGTLHRAGKGKDVSEKNRQQPSLMKSATGLNKPREGSSA